MIKFKGREIPQTLKEIVRPEHTVVIVHDMQNDLVAPGGALGKAGQNVDVSHFLGQLVRFVAEARKSKVRMMYTHYTNLPEYATFNDPMIRRSYASIVDISKHDPFLSTLDGTWGWQTIDELAPQDGDVIIKKYRVDSFIGTNLELLLRSSGIKSIIHTGIATDRGILPTALHATNLGFFALVPEDCVAGGGMKLHPEAMKFLNQIAIVTTSSEILATWKS